jgi:hypothetical protein
MPRSIALQLLKQENKARDLFAFEGDKTMQVWTLSLLFSGIIYVILAGFVFVRFRANPGAKSFVALMLSVGIYSVCYYLQIHSSTMSAMFFWLKIIYLCMAPLPALWFIFVIQYTKRDSWLNISRIAVLFVIPIITCIMVYTNNYHHFLFRSLSMELKDGLNVLSYVAGPWFWVDIIYLNLSVLIGNFILLQTWRHTPEPLNRQYAAMFLGSLAPWLGLVIYVSGHSPLNLDLSSFGMIITGLVYTFSLIHYHIFEVVSVTNVKK